MNFAPLKKILKRIVPQTYGGFPVAASEVESATEPPTRAKRGVALLITILAVSLVMIFSVNMIINSQVNSEVAMKVRDNLKAEYMAKSGANLAVFLISADFGIDLAMAQMNNQAATTDGPGDIWAMLNGLPIGGETLEMITATQEKFDLSAVNDDDTLDVLKLFDGQFTLDIQDEGSRINLNDCAQGRCNLAIGMLKAIMSCPAEKAFLETKNLTGEELAFRISDFIDKNSEVAPESGMSDEDDAYRKKVPPYAAKNVPLDTIDELKLVEGWDDDIHKVFSPYLTIYPYHDVSGKETKININTAKKEFLACLFPEANVECKDKFEAKFKEITTDGTNMAEGAGNIKQVLTDTFCYQPSTEGENKGKEGWFDTTSSVFRVNVTGTVGTQEKKLTVIYQRRMPDKAKKIERSYDILYWRLI